MDKIKLREIRDLKLAAEAKAFSRWNKRKEFRENPAGYLEKNAGEKAKMVERYNNYNIREAAKAKTELIKSTESKARTVERKIGDTLDLSKRPPSAEAYRFGIPVGRVYQIPDPGIEIDAFGSGFLIAPNLIITNNHVFPAQDYAEGCVINFKYEYNEFNKLQSGLKFRLTPEIFFLTDIDLDFTIVYAESIDESGQFKLADLGYIPLIGTKGKVIIGSQIHIVQYPLGGPKQYSTDNNIVKDILEEEGFIQYSTDTDEASSGSPAANQHWEVAALHHSGIAMTIGDKVWSKYNKPWDGTMTDADKIYIANEGVSISRIVNFLSKQKPGKPKEIELLDSVLRISHEATPESNLIITPPDSPIVVKPNLSENDVVNPFIDPKNSYMSQNVFNFYNTNNVTINASSGTVPGANPLLLPETKPAQGVPEKKLRFDENYSGRRYKGYKENFLSVNIPLPGVAAGRIGEIYKKDTSNIPLVLKYYHFSLVMNKKFRLQMWSAVNVDYDPALKTSRDRKEFGDEGNSWRLDPRIPAEIQIIDAEFYKPATQVDRGHMVRRDDSCYGNTELEIEYANSDTFHWTNCTPQHEGFNQSKQYGVWGLLENAIKDGLSGDDTKASIFAGPILTEDPERIYNDIYYPTRFWKVVATIDEDEGLLAYGFILDQTKVIDRRGLEAKFDFSKFKYQQVSLKAIEDEAGVTFPNVLKQADIFIINGLDSASPHDFESKDRIIIKTEKKKGKNNK